MTAATPEHPSPRFLLRRIVNRLAAVILLAQGPEASEEARADFYRASHEMTCPTCGETYLRHVVDPLDTWLHVLCNGERVKL